MVRSSTPFLTVVTLIVTGLIGICLLEQGVSCANEKEVGLVKVSEDRIRALIRQKLAEYKEELVVALHLDYDDDDNSQSGKFGNSNVNNVDVTDKVLSRKKRATITADNPLLLGRKRRKTTTRVSEEGGFLLDKVFRVSPQYFDHVKTFDINSLIVGNKTFMFTLELSDSGRTEIAVYRVKNSLTPIELMRAESPGANSLEVIPIDGNYYVLPLVYNWTKDNSLDPMDVGSILYRIDFVRSSLIEVQTIRTAHARSSAFWQGSGEEANNIYLAVAPEYKETRLGRRFRVDVPFYLWQGGYFDEVSTIQAYNPQAIRHFNIFSNDYLAIANFQDDSGSTNIHSEVFKYYHKESRFVSFQRIRTFGAKDIQHFSFRSGQRVEHFLAVANHCNKDENGQPNYKVKSFIMKFGIQKFVPFKSFYTYGALQLLPVTLGDKFYLVLAEIGRIRFFQYNGWTFVPLKAKTIDIPDLGTNFYSMKLRPFMYENEPYFAISSVANEFQGGLYSVKFEERNDYNKLNQDLEKWCVAARNRLYEVNITKLEEDVSNAPKLHQNELHLTNDLIFKGSLTVNYASARKMNYRGIKFDDKLAKTLHDQQRKLDELKENVAGLQERMRDVVFRDRDHEILGKVLFDNVHYNNTDLIVDGAYLATLNGMEMEIFVNNLVFTNRDLEIKSLKTDAVEVAEDAMLIPKTLNGSPLSDYALKDSPETRIFTKKNTFDEEVELGGEIEVKGLFASVDFNQPQFLLAQGNQTFQGTLNVHDSNVNYLYTKFLNGEDIVHYYKDAVPLHGEAVITGSKTFKNLTIDQLEATGLINGISIDNLYSKAIYTRRKERQLFYGTTRFKNLVVGRPVELENRLVNGKYDLERDFVNAHHGSFELGDVVLLQDCKVEELNVTSKLNKLDVVNGDFGIVLKESEVVQRIKNKKLPEIYFLTHVVADGLFAGVNLTHWDPIQKIKLRNNQIYRNFTIHGTLSAPKVKVNKQFLQGTEDILPILKNIAPLSAQKLPGTCTLVFENLKVEGNTNVKKDVNGHKPSDWVLRNNTKKSYNITGNKNFFGEVTLQQDCVAKSLFAVDDPRAENILNAVPDLLIQGLDQTIHGDTVFTDSLFIENLYCPNIILDKIPFENLMLLHSYQEVEVETHFEGITAIAPGGECEIKGDVQVGHVNDINLSWAIDDTLKLDNGPTQLVSGAWTFEGGLLVRDIEVDGKVEDLNIGKIFSSIVRKDRKEPLHLTYPPGTELSFEQGFFAPALMYSGHMNTIPHTEWGKMWLLSSGNQTVYTKIHFQDDIRVDSDLYSKSGYVGDIDVMRLNREILRIYQGGHLGSVEFLDEVEAYKIKLGPYGDGTLNNLNLQKDILHKTKEYGLQIVTGEKVFDTSLNISGNLDVPVFNGKDLNSILPFLYGKDSKAFKNKKLLIKGNLNLKYEPRPLRSVNGYLWDKIVKNVWFTNQDVKIKHPVTFEQVKLQGGAHFGHHKHQTVPYKLNGVDLDDLKRNYVSRTKDQTFKGNVVLSGPVNFKALVVNDLKILDGLFNEIDLPSFLTTVLTNGTNQTVSGKVEIDTLTANHITIRRGNIINRVNLDKDLMTLHGPNKFYEEKVVRDLDANELVLDPSATLIQGVNFTDWYLKGVKSHGNNVLHAPLELEDLEGAKLIVRGLVDGVRVDRDHILLKNGSQVIPGKMTVTSEKDEYGPTSAALTAPEGVIVNGLFNNYDLNQTFGNLVRKSEYENDTTAPLVITGEKKFLAPIKVDHILAEKLFQGLNLTQLLNDFYSGLVIPPNLTFRAKDRYEALHAFTNQAIHLSASRAVFLEYFVLTQEIPQPGLVYTRTLFGTPWPTLVLGNQVSEGKQTETWFAYNLDTDLYQMQIGKRISIEGTVRDFMEVEANGAQFIIMSVAGVKNRPATVSLEQRPPTPRQTRGAAAANYTDIIRASGLMGRTFILKAMEVARVKGKSQWVVSQTIHGKDFGPLESFVIFENGVIVTCIFATSLNGLYSLGEILCLDPPNSNRSKNAVFTPYQAIPLQNPTLTTTMEAVNRTLLMISTKGVTEPERVIEVWAHTSGLAQGFSKESCVSVFNPVSIDSTFGSNSNPFLAVASGAEPSLHYLGAVFIYRYSTEKKEFEKTQTLEIDFPLEVRLHMLHPSKEVVLFVLAQTPMNNILVYKFQGLAGWSLKHKWTCEGAKSLEVSDFSMRDVYKAQVIVSGGNLTTVYTAEFKGLSLAPGVPPSPQSGIYYPDPDNDFDA